MSYLVLARKYRPQAFDEIVGQSHISETLKNAIKSAKISHAYLFSGPRGVGKTTAARIFAKALNCEKGPSPVPCNKCSHCTEITGGNALDVLEIDGASNRGIDEIRALRENVKFVPSSCRYKIYIIDEAHQVTKEAFNALLKTLEEPPAHVIFIMATTEPQKIPGTILSRCQRFSFKLLTHREIFERLKHIVDAEKIKIEEDALDLITSAAQGSMRDGLSILDQIVSYTGDEKVRGEEVTFILGILPWEILLEFSQLMAQSKIKEVFSLIDEITEKGYGLDRFVLDLLNHFRNLLMVKVVGKNEKVLDLPEKNMEALSRMSEKFEEDSLIRIINILSQVSESMKWSEQPRTVLEVGMFQAGQPYVSIDTVIQRISALEKKLAGGSGEDDVPPLPRREEKEVWGGEEPAPAEPAEGKTQEAHTPVPGDDPVKSRWQEVLADVRSISQSLYTYLCEGVPGRIDGESFVIDFLPGKEFHKGMVEKKKKVIETSIKKVTGKDVSVRTAISVSVGKESIALPDEEESPLPDDFSDEIKKSEHVLGKILDMFDGKIIKKEEEEKE